MTSRAHTIRSLVEDLRQLDTMKTRELCDLHAEVFGEPTRSRNRTWLIDRLAWKLQVEAEGGPAKAAMAKVEEAARRLEEQAPARWNRPAGSRGRRDPRLPPAGTVLRRAYQGQLHEVTVLADGFRYGGTVHKSLSGIAAEITGTAWNGFLFFGLKKRGLRNPKA